MAASALALALAGAGCGGGEAPSDDDGAPVAPVGSLIDGRPAQAALDLEATRRAVLAEGLDRLEVDAGPPGKAEDARFPELARARTFGPPARPIAESPRVVARETPRALLASTLEALAAGDVAALCRASAAREDRPVLDEDDAAAARRRFLDASARPAWARIADAARRGAVEVQLDERRADQAVLRVQAGGAVGAYVLRLVKRGDGWYLAS